MSEEVHSLVAAYVVDGLDSVERESFEAHLSSCEDCRAEVAELTDITATLAGAAAVEPPATLKARVFDAIAQTPQETPVPSPSQAGTAAPARRWGRLALVAASLLVLASAGVVGGTVWHERSQDLALEQDVMMVTSAPDAHSMDLELGASHLVMSERMGAVVVMGQDAPAPTDGMEYQLWLVMDDGSTMPGPTFMPASDGDFMAMMRTGFDDVSGFAVTEEPMGGSSQPTSAPVATLSI
jgi:anti-sigma-K factor RskA